MLVNDILHHSIMIVSVVRKSYVDNSFIVFEPIACALSTVQVFIEELLQSRRGARTLHSTSLLQHGNNRSVDSIPRTQCCSGLQIQQS